MPFDHAYALLVGVGSYAHVPQLDVPITVSDAREVADALRDPELCGYPAGNVVLLHDAAAARQNVLDTFDALATSLMPTDTLFLFYSGHGDLGTDGYYHLTTHDTEIEGNRVKAGTGISEVELVDRLRAIEAKRLLFCFNACHAGEISPSLDPAPASSFGDKTLATKAADALLSTGEGRIIITACREMQRSYIGNGPVTLFAQALIDGLHGAGEVVNSRGYVSAFNLYEHIYFAVKEAADQFRAVQEPELTVLKGIGPFPVALYQGATQLGSFDENEAPPDGTAVRTVERGRSQRLLNRYIQSINVRASGDRSVAVGGNVTNSTIVTGDGNRVQ